ncbi:DUF421 domain-containing protein [Alkalibaculum bacchi]|uniref:DUF421 domain-containing protein n=1 Tax=Alkalibaculum bacchi TaxID=645887 RepID=UPI0026F1E0FB|nr:DUF421 domain-containing protein [Alkalibaculum bacchi]
MHIIFIRTVILYLAVFLVIRLMGKRQVGEMQPSELIVTIMTADIATGPLESIDTPLFNGLIPLISMLFIDSFMILGILKTRIGRRLVTGKPSFLMKDGILQEKEMKTQRISLSDLHEELRSQGYPLLHEINTIILETNGQMSIICKDNSSLPVNVIADGLRLHENLKEGNITEKWLDTELNKNGIVSDKEVFLAYVSDGNLYFHRKEQ